MSGRPSPFFQPSGVRESLGFKDSAVRFPQNSSPRHRLLPLLVPLGSAVCLSRALQPVTSLSCAHPRPCYLCCFHAPAKTKLPREYSHYPPGTGVSCKQSPAESLRTPYLQWRDSNWAPTVPPTWAEDTYQILLTRGPAEYDTGPGGVSSANPCNPTGSLWPTRKCTNAPSGPAPNDRSVNPQRSQSPK